ncbi:MAG: outer-membrane lipoprotein carrier protein LolA [Deltaproteobacteria bacterium]|nr:outer-membrane lipoprotein carrier protein LolA [Deltaproteobacteria bacterium]
MPEEEGRYRVKIEPVKDGSGFENAVLHIDREELTILRFELTDLMGNRTLVILKNTKMNPGLSASLFSYTPGPDVEVIKGP